MAIIGPAPLNSRDADHDAQRRAGGERINQAHYTARQQQEGDDQQGGALLFEQFFAQEDRLLRSGFSMLQLHSLCCDPQGTLFSECSIIVVTF